MNPLMHVLTTFLAYLTVNFFHPLGIEVLIWAVVLTVGVDVLDHGFIILTLKNPTVRKARGLLFKGRFMEAYRVYYINRRRVVSYCILHNIPVIVIMIYLTIHFQSAILALGLLLHYFLDIIDHYREVGNLDFWLRID
ncbi:MAG: hypothetical protein ABH851_06510 [Methanobacteriota archaeon]